RLEVTARELGIAERVSFRGFVDDVHSELAGLDVLVHASTIPEPLGQVVLEGMAVGLPVIAANAGGPAEVIDDGVDGLLYPMGDDAAMAECLRRLAGDEALRSRLGREGRKRAEAFSSEAVAAQVLAVYREVAPGS